MKCPHCLESFHEQKTLNDLGSDQDWIFNIISMNCPACSRFIAILSQIRRGGGKSQRIIYPKEMARQALHAAVPEQFAGDYREACLVLSDSPKASAALSRRCLQNLLRGPGGVKPQDLSKEIDAVLAAKQLPSYLANSIDAVRAIGNFAAHPIKSTSSGEIVDVEPGEAEWQLDVVEGLFDFYFVQPAEIQRKKEDLNKKLTDAGKPPLK